MKKKGTTVTTKRGGRGLLFLILGMLALTFGLTAIFAALMEGGSIPEEKTGLLAAITVGAVSLAACAILAARAQEKKLLRGILGAAIYAVMLLLGNLLDDVCKFFVHALRQFETVERIHNEGYAALSGLAVDTNDWLVLSADVGRIDRKVRNLPVLAVSLMESL